MTWLFRSKSYGPAPPCSLFQDFNKKENEDDDAKEQELDSDGGDDYDDDDDDDDSSNPVSTPFISPKSKEDTTSATLGHRSQCNSQNQFTILDIVVAALKKSLVTCRVERDDVSSSLNIGWPTDVCHVSHVTFDRFNGFLGLPSELEPEVPTRVPSASAKVFGVSVKSMQCSYDDRGNSVPTILLMMQKQLYSDGGGLKAEGIFRINAENSQEEFVREQLNKGLVPHGIDVHCLSGLIKAWFRELPTGVLDSLTPEQVMQCNTEEDCTNLVKLLPSTEAALLDWAINLMADVVENEQFNKMNARNIAMVFAPNMTQMGDPLNALIHAVQVMNLLKTLILKTLKERHESIAKAKLIPSCIDSPSYNKNGPEAPPFNFNRVQSCEPKTDDDDDTCDTKAPTKSRLSRTSTLGRIEWSVEKLWRSEQREKEKGNGDGDGDGGFKHVSSGRRTHSRYETSTLENSYSYRGRYDSEHWLRFRKGVRKLYSHPLFQFSKPSSKKDTSLGIVNN